MLLQIFKQRPTAGINDVDVRTLELWKDLVDNELTFTNQAAAEDARARVEKISNIVFPYIL
ncbi:MAG: hypothetical protein AAF431_12240 [Pseudomonadota bacterium]